MAADRPEREARKARRRAAEAAAANAVRPDLAVVLGDIDAWNLRQEGDWWRFEARLGAGARGYQRPVAGGDIIADAPGPLTGILGFGGPREAGFTRGPAHYPHHIVAPRDHIGSVGMEGTAQAALTDGLQRIAHRAPVALLADEILATRESALRALPLFCVRAETEAAARLEDLAKGAAFGNFCTALDNLCAAAQSLGRPARVLAVRLDYGLEDCSSDSAALLGGWRALMARISAELRRRDLAPPVFLMRGESGTAGISDHPAIRAGWELAWNHAPHQLIITAPAYAFEQDRFGHLTDAGRSDQARIDAHALAAVEQGEGWAAPLPLIAEGASDDQTGRVEVVFSALSDLVLDAADPFGAGQAAGFRLIAGARDIAIHRVSVHEADPRRLVLDCAPWEGEAELFHACSLAPVHDGRGINRSLVRDQWQGAGENGPLHRWALPAVLPVHPLLPAKVRS